MNSEEVKKKRLLTGVVVSKKMMKTASVMVEWLRKDKRVKKIVRMRRKVHVHDPLDEAMVGDKISFYEGRPMSKTKTMHFHAIVSRNKDFAELGGKQ